MAKRSSQKEAGAYYTPDSVVGSLLRWVIRREGDRLLDPSCGDGRFIAGHQNSVGIEQDLVAAHAAMKRARWAEVHENDFFPGRRRRRNDSIVLPAIRLSFVIRASRAKPALSH